MKFVACLIDRAEVWEQTAVRPNFSCWIGFAVFVERSAIHASDGTRCGGLGRGAEPPGADYRLIDILEACLVKAVVTNVS